MGPRCRRHERRRRFAVNLPPERHMMKLPRHFLAAAGTALVAAAGLALAVHAADDKPAAAASAPKAALTVTTTTPQAAEVPVTTGALSAQQINQYLTAERTAKARLDAQRAAARVQELRMRQTQVLAPDDGVISARHATVGAVLPAGQELFRLIRQGRLEWRAEV